MGSIKIMLKRKGFLSSKEHWGSSISIEKFINKFANYEERDTILANQSKICFLNESGSIMDYKDGLSIYRKIEEDYLNNVWELQKSMFGQMAV